MQLSMQHPTKAALASKVKQRCPGPRSLTAVPSQRSRLVMAKASEEPARAMALPGNSLWLLSYLQDQFYDIRGPQFVITRNESMGTALRKARSSNKGLVRTTPGGGNTPESNNLGLIHQATRSYPWQSTQLLEGEMVDISEYMEPCSDSEEEDRAGEVQANTTCTGIVRMEVEEEEGHQVDEEADVFFTNSTSPRRTKMVGFTCKCCGARNYNSVNPQAFLEGTLVAQCAKCERWHKLSDHFKLFHDLKGPLLRGRSTLSVDDVPPSLRLDPLYWANLDDDMMPVDEDMMP